MDINNKEEAINVIIKDSGVDTNKISDGYHTFEQLYEHRIVLFMTLCRWIPNRIWKSKAHSDGSIWDGWFILGINSEQGKQITYHLPEKYWEDCGFAHTVLKAPEWDGHSSEDVLKRLAEL